MGVSIEKQVENLKKKNVHLEATIGNRIKKARDRMNAEQKLIETLKADFVTLTGREI